MGNFVDSFSQGRPDMTGLGEFKQDVKMSAVCNACRQLFAVVNRNQWKHIQAGGKPYCSKGGCQATADRERSKASRKKKAGKSHA